MTDHEDFVLLAAKRISEPLSPAEDAALEAHLARCPACRSIAADMRRDDFRLRAELGRATVAPRVRQRVLEEASGGRRLAAGRLMLVLAATLGLAAIGLPLITGRAPDPVTSVAPSPSVSPLRSSASVAPSTSAASPTAIASPSPSVPAGVGPFVDGAYTYGQLVRRDTLAAWFEGEPTGAWSRTTTVRGKLESYGGPVSCLVISGTDAWLAGRVTTATDGRTDLAIFFHVHDGGPDGDGDMAIGWLSESGETIATMEGWCRTRFIPTGPFPLTTGDLIVQADPQ